MVCFECFGLRLRFHWLSAVTAVFLFLAFSSLGIWQFGKAKAKIEALEQSEVLASQEPVNLRELSFGGLVSDRISLQGKGVFINGHYLNDKNIFPHLQTLPGHDRLRGNHAV